MLCSRYGPVTLGWSGERVVVNPRDCTEWTPLRDFAKSIYIDVDRRLRLLLDIPRGYVTTYKLYGMAIGATPRQVGRLLATNKLPVILPCHRVVMSNMELGGYIAGVRVKRDLLEYEGALCGGRPCRVYIPRAVEEG